jgi:4-diphosphocytidyl-2-C-methyl-D-erythritol kinase
MPETRAARLPAFAKVNLSLVVLHKRADGYHELRTVFQTISLADRLDVEFTPARRTAIEVECTPEIPDNLVERAARMLFEEERIAGRLRIRLHKRIPMGGGCGGGSSYAAAVLLGVPAMAGRRVDAERLHGMAERLGSDVPFFLHGGTAIGLGRGEELYPVPSLRAPNALLVAPGIHVSTPEAFRDLARPGPELTSEVRVNKMKGFRAFARALAVDGGWEAHSGNDFEAAAFGRHPEIAALHRALLDLGARPARMSGSGSALFGVFPSPGARDRARASLLEANPRISVHPVKFITREQYRAAWRRALSAFV